LQAEGCRFNPGPLHQYYANFSLPPNRGFALANREKQRDVDPVFDN